MNLKIYVCTTNKQSSGRCSIIEFTDKEFERLITGDTLSLERNQVIECFSHFRNELAEWYINPKGVKELECGCDLICFGLIKENVMETFINRLIIKE